MVSLTFGEQVKIVLKRKNMTIKELAEKIEEQTKTKMSRQNLTQRLGRDNFQEQDMRMIANILECNFSLNILDIEVETNIETNIETVETNVETNIEISQKETEEFGAERDITIGELVQLHEELDALALEQIPSEQILSEQMPLEEEEMELGQEVLELEQSGQSLERSEQEYPEVETEEEESFAESTVVVETITSKLSAEIRDENEEVFAILEELEKLEESKRLKNEEIEIKETIESTEITEVKEEAKKEVKKGGMGTVFKKYFRKQEEKISQIKKGQSQSEKQEKELELQVEELESEEVKESEEVTTNEEVHKEINPYTDEEYETNSVRVHPKRLGYVQVYDRANHKWTDMTEWAFLGYQERKKALLGSQYEPPIYLD